MAITTNEVKTIFPNSSQDIDRIIISFADDDDSLVKLSCVNKAGNQILTNIFFKVRFNAEHRVLKDFPLKFELLCNFVPDCCWKIACCAFSKGEFSLSHTFISEQSPNIRNFILLEKTKAEAEQREISGSFYQDPNSQIDQAWKDYETTKRLEDEYIQCMEPMQLELDACFGQFLVDFPELHQFQIGRNLAIFSMIVNSYTDEQILNPNDEVTIAIHDDMFNFFKNAFQSTDDNEMRHMCDRLIAEEFSNIIELLRLNSDLARHACKLIAKIELLSENYRRESPFEHSAVWKAKQKYNNLESKRVSCVGKLERIGKMLATFDPSGKLPLIRTVWNSGKITCYEYENPHTAWYSHILQQEFNRTQRAEIAIMRLPHLENCRSIILNLLEHPEEISDATLETIRLMINSCDIQDIGRIWGGLYEQCANEVQEDQWSEKHFPEFLDHLGGIVGQVVWQYNYDSQYITEQNREDNIFNQFYYALKFQIE